MSGIYDENAVYISSNEKIAFQKLLAILKRGILPPLKKQVFLLEGYLPHDDNFFLLTKLFENLLLAKYLIFVTVTLNYQNVYLQSPLQTCRKFAESLKFQFYYYQKIRSIKLMTSICLSLDILSWRLFYFVYFII